MYLTLDLTELRTKIETFLRFIGISNCFQLESGNKICLLKNFQFTDLLC